MDRIPSCGKSQTCVVRRPASTGVTEGWAQQLHSLGERRLTLSLGQSIEGPAGKGSQPWGYSRWQGCGSWHQAHEEHLETRRGETRLEFLDRDEVPRQRDVNTVSGGDRPQSGTNSRHTAVTAEFADESSVRSQRAVDTVEYRCQIRDPVKDRVREHRVERANKRERLRIDQTHIEAAGPRRRQQAGRGVNPDHDAAPRRKVFGQRAVATPEVENAFAGLRLQQVDNRLSQIGHKSCVRRVVGGVPLLGGHIAHDQVSFVILSNRNTSLCDSLREWLMDFTHLASFVAVAEELHFSRAAARRHLSQPALSKQVQQLERVTGLTLFVRNRRTVRLTPEGMALLPRAKAAILAAGEVQELAGQLRRGVIGRIRVGFTPSAPHDVLQGLLRRFRRRCPDVEPDLIEASSRVQLHALQRGSLDVGLLRPPRPRSADLQWHDLSREPFVVAMPRDHALARRKRIALRALDHVPLVLVARRASPDVYDYLLESCRAVGIVPNVRREASQVHTALALVGVFVLAHAAGLVSPMVTAFTETAVLGTGSPL
jgi:DNA-binding transcriptional LysR family regulator